MEYRQKAAFYYDGAAPRVNTWVQVAAANARHAKAADRSAALTPALVSAVTIEDGVGSAVVIYPNPLVLFHAFQGPPLKRVLVPFQRLRPFFGNSQEMQKLEERLMEALRVITSAPSAKGQAPSSRRQIEASSTLDHGDDAPPDVKSPDFKPLKSKELAKFTVAVSRALRASADNRLARADLAATLAEDGFTSDLFADGLEQLQAANKIFLADELVFAV